MSNLANFKIASRRLISPMGDIQFTSENQSINRELPQVGYLAKLRLTCFGTITTGAAGAGTWDPNFWPFNLFNRITLRTNDGVMLYDTSGYGNLKLNMARKIAFVHVQDPPVILFNNPTTGPQTAVSSYPTGAIGASTIYNVLVNYIIPVAFSENLSVGLILLQNQATKVTLDMQLNSFANWGGTAGLSSVNITVRPSVEYYEVPASPDAQPNTNFVHQVLEDEVGWTSSGEIQWLVPVGGIVSRCWMDFQDVSGGRFVPRSFFTTGDNPNTPRFGNTFVRYGGANQPEQVDIRTRLLMTRETYRADLPQGVILFDFSDGAGSPELGYDGSLVYNTAGLTEFQLAVVVNDAPAAGAKIVRMQQRLLRRAVG